MARIDHGTTRGTFNLDGETHQVENNVWIVGDDAECMIVDAPHDVGPILAIVGDRRVIAIVCTHAHDDHVRAALTLRDRVNDGEGAPVMLHPEDEPLWELVHGHSPWDVDLVDGQVLAVAGIRVTVLHTPGHSPGAVCLYAEELECVFTGDTLFAGGPGATGRSYSDADVIVDSIRRVLFRLPDETIVHTGHGPDTTIAGERELLGTG